MSHPRVLHVGFLPIGAPTNSGLTLGSLFGQWPQDSLLQLCLRNYEEREPPNLILAPVSIAPADGLVRAVLGRALRPGPTDGLNHAVSRSDQQLPWRFRARLAASTLNDIGPVWVRKPLVRQIEQFRPQVVHSLLGGVRAMRLTTALARRFDIPVVPHFMDDWIDNLFNDGQLWGQARRTVDACLKDILDRSPVCLTIGEDMEREYTDRLGRPCVTVGNSVDLGSYSALTPHRADGSAPRRMRYVGGLHLGRPRVIRSIAGTLDAANPGGRPWVVELFVPPEDIAQAESLAAEFASVSYGGSLAPGEVPQALVDADALLFLESPEPHISRFTRLSVSTKVPQYLASGRPILVAGPQDQGSVRVITASGAGVFAGDGMDHDTVLVALKELERLPQLNGQAALSPERAQWIESRFGAAGARDRLRESLTRAVTDSTVGAVKAAR